MGRWQKDYKPEVQTPVKVGQVWSKNDKLYKIVDVWYKPFYECGASLLFSNNPTDKDYAILHFVEFYQHSEWRSFECLGHIDEHTSEQWFIEKHKRNMIKDAKQKVLDEQEKERIYALQCLTNKQE